MLEWKCLSMKDVKGKGLFFSDWNDFYLLKLLGCRSLLQNRMDFGFWESEKKLDGFKSGEYGSYK